MRAVQQEAVDPRQRPLDPKYEKQLVDYSGKEGPGTIVVDTPNKFLYLVEGNGKARAEPAGELFATGLAAEREAFAATPPRRRSGA